MITVLFNLKLHPGITQPNIYIYTVQLHMLTYILRPLFHYLQPQKTVQQQEQEVREIIYICRNNEIIISTSRKH